MRVYGVILAGGSGVRLGASMPKQFLPLGGVPIIVRTIRQVLSHPAFDVMVIAVLPDWREALMKMLEKAGIGTGRIVLTDGGASRTDSMRKAVARLRDLGAADEDVAVFFDAVRPFVDAGVIGRCLDGVGETGVCVAVVPAVDTLLEVEDGIVVSVPPRSRLAHGQTPCGARLEIVENALTKTYDVEITGTAQLLALSGATVRTVAGSCDNFKITTADDVARAERLVSSD